MANNNFGYLSNAKFGGFEHPRFGTITCIFSTKTIEKGDEIFVDYNFDQNCPVIRRLAPWYFKQYEEFLKNSSNKV